MGLLFLDFLKIIWVFSWQTKISDSVEAQELWHRSTSWAAIIRVRLEGLVPNAILAGLVDALEGNMPRYLLKLCTKHCVKCMSVPTLVVSRQAALAEEGQNS